jgi:hypothetical protein
LGVAAIHLPESVLRVLMIFDGVIITLFEVQFPFRFPHAVGESGKRNWERDGRVQLRVEELDPLVETTG